MTHVTEQARQAARAQIHAQGISLRAFARRHQLHPSTVYGVLNGQNKCLRGEAHRAAVLLGIKPQQAPRLDGVTDEETKA
jgi:gp16 family phage-associated protein